LGNGREREKEFPEQRALVLSQGGKNRGSGLKEGDRKYVKIAKLQTAIKMTPIRRGKTR